MKPRKAIRKVSQRQAVRLKEYAKVKKYWLAHESNKYCPVMLDMFGKTIRATECHHIRGRIGTLLFNRQYFLAVSRQGHQWIQDHPAEARKRGWLCAKGDWNRQAKD